MATPDRNNWVNQAVREVANVLKLSPAFMAASALSGGTGVVVAVAEHDLDRDLMNRHGVVYCALRFQGAEPSSEMDTAGADEYWVSVGVHLEAKVTADARQADRQAIWMAVQRAAAAVFPLIKATIASNGSDFGAFCYYATPLPMHPSEASDEDSHYAIVETGVRLQVTIPDAS